MLKGTQVDRLRKRFIIDTLETVDIQDFYKNVRKVIGIH